MTRTDSNRPRGAWLITASIVAASAVTSHLAGQSTITTTVQVSRDRSFLPLQSYTQGETGSSIIFFSGLVDMGLHFLGTNAFPLKNFSTEIVIVDKATGTLATGSINHLPDTIREVLTVTAPASVQFDTTLYLYGGYGPAIVRPDLTTRDSVTEIDLLEVETAILSAQPVPASAFSIMPSSTAQVSGGGIVKFSDGNRFALICGANAVGDYGNTGDPIYSNEIYIFDRSVSMTVPIQVFNDGLGFDSPMHRRDVNTLPVTLPAQGGGARDGFIVVCGVFESGIFPYENPLLWGDGDAEVSLVKTATQHVGAYEGPTASLYSENERTNHIINCSGLSAYEPDGQGGWIWNFATPWTDEIGHMKVIDGVVQDDVLSGTMPWPVTNAHLIVEDSLPKNSMGQVLLDQLPRDTDILLGRIYGGIAAETPGDFPPTFASDDVLEVFFRVNTDAGTRADLLSFAVERGIEQGGGLPELMNSDDTYLQIRSQFGTSLFEPFLNQIDYQFQTNTPNPVTLDIIEEVRATTGIATSKLSLRNVNTGRYDPVETYGLQQTDTIHRVSEIPAADYVGGDGTITMRIKHVAIGTFFSFSFNSFIDEIAIEEFE